MDEKEMPKYECHKVVGALKIGSVQEQDDGALILQFEEKGYLGKRVSRVWAEKHRPLAGGYYVVYEDDYSSYSPAEAFEAGYTRMGELTKMAVENHGRINAPRVLAEFLVGDNCAECGCRLDDPEEDSCNHCREVKAVICDQLKMAEIYDAAPATDPNSPTRK